MRKFPGTGQEEEAGAKELQARKELARLSAEVVEGEQRLATLRAELEGPPASRHFVHSSDPAVEVQKVRVELMDMQKERDALKAALEAQRNCMGTSGPASPGTRMSALIDDAAKRRCLEG